MWLKKVGFHQPICCYSYVETDGIHLEHFPWLSGSSNSKAVFEKACVRMALCVCYFDVGLAKPSQVKVLTEGGDLHEVQVDLLLSVSNSCFWPHRWAQ